MKMNRQLSICRLMLFICITALVFIPELEARKIRTKHSVSKLSAKQLEEEKSLKLPGISMSSDSATFVNRIRPAVRFYGFDKTVTSNMESFFISNSLDSTLNGLEVRITYTDLKGRQLNKRDVRLDCEVPPHETIRTDIKSWDTQKSFYFHRSVQPKRQATPFDVRIELLSVTL